LDTESSLADEKREYLTRPEVEREFRLRVGWLAKAAMSGEGPPYVKVGGRVLYRRATLEAWMSKHERRSTAELAA
jgi:hypothetical protein